MGSPDLVLHIASLVHGSLIIRTDTFLQCGEAAMINAAARASVYRYSTPYIQHVCAVNPKKRSPFYQPY